MIPPGARTKGEEAMLNVLRRHHPNVYWRIVDEPPIAYPGLDPATSDLVEGVLDAVGDATGSRVSTDQAKAELGSGSWRA